MRPCPDCGRSLADQSSTDPVRCPSCRGARLAGSAETWTPVARLTNLAEAGFAEDLLADEGIPSCIRQHQDFSAVDGSWTPVYILQAPAELAGQAAERIRQELVATAPAGGSRPDEDATATVPWGPLTLMLLAGCLVYLAARGGLWRPPDAVDPATSRNLWDAVRAIDRPFESDSAAGGPHYRLDFATDREIATLDEDHDGDGRYERRRAFHRSRAERWTERNPQ